MRLADKRYDIIQIALASRTALLDLHDFLRQHIGDVPEQLQRQLRQHFGSQWTSTVKHQLYEIYQTVDPQGPNVAMCVLKAIRILFQAMVSGIASSSLPTETKTIIGRKWMAIMPSVRSSDPFHESPEIWRTEWVQLRMQVQSLIANVS